MNVTVMKYKVRDWFKKNKKKIIVGGGLTCAGLLGYSLLGNDIQIDGFFKKLPVDCWGTTITKPDGKTANTIEVVFRTDPIHLGKFTIEGKEIGRVFDEKSAINLADTLYETFGKIPPDITVQTF